MKNRVGYLYLTLTCCIWGSVYVASKYALASLGPVTVICIRYLVAAACLAVMMHLRGGRVPVRRGDMKYIWIVGGLGYFVSIVCQMVGTKLLDASLASLINSMNPITISLFAALFLRERILPRHVVGICASLAGIYIILGVGGTGINPWGVAVSVCSVLLWSTSSVSIRRISGGYDPVQISLYGMLVALLFTIPSAALECMKTPPVFTREAVLACVYLGVVGTGVAHTLWNTSLKLLDAGVCSMFYPIQPLTSAVLGILLFHEVITVSFVTGGILICLGVLVSLIDWRKLLSAAGKRRA